MAVAFLVESTWISLAAEPSAWRVDGSDEPFTAAVVGLVLVDLLLRIGIGFTVARDVKALGADRLKMAQVPATSLERTSAVGWGVTAGIFTLVVAIVYSMYRRQLRDMAGQAREAPQFAVRKDRKAAHKSPGVFSADQLKAVKRRGDRQGWVILGLFVGLGVLNRVLSGL